MEERKSPLKNIGCAVLGIYCVSVMLFAPYYNWKFAQRAGFVPWLFGGDIMGTFKGVLWPYFLWSDHSEGVRRQQATAYFAALNQVGSGHEPINEMLDNCDHSRWPSNPKYLAMQRVKSSLRKTATRSSSCITLILTKPQLSCRPPLLSNSTRKSLKRIGRGEN